MRFIVTLGGNAVPVEVAERDGGYRVQVGEEWFDVDARMSATGPCSLLIEGASYLVDLRDEAGDVVATLDGEIHRLRVEDPGRRGRDGAAGRPPGSGQRLIAPMPGRVVAVPVRPGDHVEPGTPLVVLEAMKMENEFRATVRGVVAEVRVTAGQAVNAGDLLVVVSASS